MNYTLHQLWVFSKVVEYKSITRASEDLHMTQPAVSIQLKNLQDQFDLPLTEVIGRKLYVTEFGKEINRMAETILAEVTAINLKNKSFAGQLAGKLRLAVVSTGKYVIPYYLNEFIHAHQGITLHMDVTNKSKVLEALQNNEIDFALVSTLPQDLKVNQEPLLENELYLVSNPDYAKHFKTASKTAKPKLTLIKREIGSATRQATESYIKKGKLNIDKTLELTSNEAVKQAIIAGLGVSIMPLIGLKHELQTGELEIIPSTGLPIKTSWRLIWMKGKKLNPVSQAFLDYVKKNKAEVYQNQFTWTETFTAKKEKKLKKHP